jgi:tetratricopeptide (TPR) repeat protein
MNGVAPNSVPVRRWTVTTHLRFGQALVEAGQEVEALAEFDTAVALAPKDPDSLLWQGTTRRYLAGRKAFEAGEWDEAIKSFKRAYKNIPDYSDAFPRLVNSYRRKGESAIEGENWLTAIKAIQEAIKRTPDGTPAMAELEVLLSAAYRGQGQADMANQDWTAAIDVLTEAQEQLPGDQAVVNLLARAYRQRGIARQEAIKMRPAKADLEMALALQPNDEKARKHLAQVKHILSKKIEIDISKQRLYAYADNKLVYKWRVSTGLRGRDTATGHFQVLDKIPMAYSRVWRLKMPYWLGIYWVQGIENGIHALPIRPNGSIMWGGLLGQRASYGCVILSKSAAKTLYNWADIGTPVHIHR